ncbi:MAG: beta-propeller domain-containing protein [Saccharofermentanales bacterium]
MRRTALKTISAIVAVLMAMTLLASCSWVAKPEGVAADDLKTYDSYTDITKLIKKSLTAGNGAAGLWRNLLGAKNGTADMAAEGAPQESRTGDDGARDTTDYSTTNLQVVGVDEADIIKTDGEYLYVISNGRLIIVDIRNPQLMVVVSETVYIKNATDYNDKTIMPVEMFLDTENNLITLICYTYDNRLYDVMAEQAAADSAEAAPAKDMAGIAPDYYYGYWGQQSVLAQVIDVSDVASPTVTREFSQEGSYVSSRRINEDVYLITNKYLYYFTDLEGDVSAELLIPAYRDSAASDEWEMFPVDSLLVVENRDYNNFLILTAIDTMDKTAEVSSQSILGAGQNVYASATSIYISSSRYTYDEAAAAKNAETTTNTEPRTDGTAPDAEETAPADDGGTQTASAIDPAGTTVNEGDKAETPPDETVTDSKDSVVDKAVDVVFEIFEAPVYTVFTDIFRFSISDGKIAASGSGVVPGYALNQFAMDEHEGYFRIATTTGETWRSDEFTSMNNLYVLDSDLKIKGKVEGLGSTETIKSVRFMGDRAFMVTFRTTDPLFVFDLSNPAAPAVKGELKIPGYSEYLHPVSENIILGFGKNTAEIDGVAIEKGYKVSVFDVSDLSNPVEISTLAIGDRGTSSELSYNHKALLYSEEKNIIGFPITIYQVPESQKEDRWAYGMPVFSGYMILGLTEDNKLFERARIGHIEMEIPEGYPDNYQYKDSDWEIYNRIYSYSYLYAVKRGVFVDDTLFTISDYIVKANKIADFSFISEVKMPGFEEINYYYFNQPVYEDKPVDGTDVKPEPGSTDGSAGSDGTIAPDSGTGSGQVDPAEPDKR